MFIKKQLRGNRYNVNLTDDESDLFVAVSKLTGIEIGVILRQMVLKQALVTLIAEDSQEDFTLEKFIREGASDHLERS